jgi:hypothetical protein
MPRYKKKKLSEVLADAVLSCNCNGNLKIYFRYTESEYKKEAVDGYSFYVKELADDLHRIVAEMIRERIKRV